MECFTPPPPKSLIIPCKGDPRHRLSTCQIVQIHRIPVVNKEAKLVGIVTRTDIFTALENQQGNVDVKVSL